MDELIQRMHVQSVARSKVNRKTLNRFRRDKKKKAERIWSEELRYRDKVGVFWPSYKHCAHTKLNIALRSLKLDYSLRA